MKTIAIQVSDAAFDALSHMSGGKPAHWLEKHVAHLMGDPPPDKVCTFCEERFTQYAVPMEVTRTDTQDILWIHAGCLARLHSAVTRPQLPGDVVEWAQRIGLPVGMTTDGGLSGFTMPLYYTTGSGVRYVKTSAPPPCVPLKGDWPPGTTHDTIKANPLQEDSPEIQVHDVPLRGAEPS